MKKDIKKKRCNILDDNSGQSQQREYDNDSLDGQGMDVETMSDLSVVKQTLNTNNLRREKDSQSQITSAESTSSTVIPLLRIDESLNSNAVSQRQEVLTNDKMAEMQQNEQTNRQNRSYFSQPNLLNRNQGNDNQIKQILMISTMDNIRLTNLNPIKIARGINEICPEKVETIQRHSSGGIIITVKNNDQAEILLKTSFFMNMYPVKTAPYANVEMCYAKIYAPEFAEDDLESLTNMLAESGVKSIRKLYKDPQKGKIPLYVLAFEGTKCPERITVGYSIYNLEPYYPSPMRCTNCNKLRHTARNCTVKEKRCSKCGMGGHLRAECKSNEPRCANCRQGHDAWSRDCPYYQTELAVCKLRTERGISFREARRLVKEGKQNMHAAGSTQNRSIRIHNKSMPSSNAHNVQFSGIHNSQTELPSLEQEFPTQESTIYRADQYEEMYLSLPESSIARKETDSIPCNPRRWEQVRGISHRPIASGTLHSQQFRKDAIRYEQKMEEILNKTQKLETLMYDLIPMMIVLAMSRNIEEKIECIEEIGKKCNVIDKVRNIVSEYGIASKTDKV